jgi:Domain of unknown function (DUF4062)
MADYRKNYNVFISSPGGVEMERKIAEKVISDVGRTVKDTLKISLDVLMWEQLPPVTSNLPTEKIQDIINKEVNKSDFFILILHKRYGNIEDGSKTSNTEREIETILRRHQEVAGSIKILVYFKKIEENRDQGEQEKQARGLRDKLSFLIILFTIYIILY